MERASSAQGHAVADTSESHSCSQIEGTFLPELLSLLWENSEEALDFLELELQKVVSYRLHAKNHTLAAKSS